MSELSELLFGKTDKIKLADGNEYTIREPAIEDLEAVEFDTTRMDDIKNIRKLAWMTLRKDNQNLTEMSIGRLITFSMLNEKSEFLGKLFSILGIEKNAAGAANPGNQDGTK